MLVDDSDSAVSSVAAAIAEPARTRMLCCLMDGHARTSTELAIVADVSPSTASAHLARLKEQRLVTLHVQGRHRYYSLAGKWVAQALEALMVVAGRSPSRFVPNTPDRLQHARTCYDHMAGSLGVSLHDRLIELGWLAMPGEESQDHELTQSGERALADFGIDLDAARKLRRRFAYPCMDWSMRRPHLAGALGAALFELAQRRQWVRQDLDSRALTLTASGQKALRAKFGVVLEAPESL
ncbi:DNA-binding transcriptional regulator, ArsR family [Modicisalibacter muralis]|uniref:DNA-binding transcriptional regulator, ArsR family n=2 Tax=Modicisalibacter muralis TaxID=119000 RepID=A0A1G9S216_9GAMM|nr:DNA-binding transcriptional regulator, ArsR family [Halomonas muralis]